MKYILVTFLLSISSFAAAIGDKEYNKKYDPTRNSFNDLELAKKDAKASGKLILVEFGGEWCIWCHRIESFISSTPEVNTGIDDVFVFLKINVSDENKNEKFVSQFPPIKGYPFFVIVDSNGVVLGSQGTGSLELEKSYSVDRFKEFIAKWSVVKNKK